jgi:ubiquinone/menaquinone biosynthesis C-methylase UbiE
MIFEGIESLTPGGLAITRLLAQQCGINATSQVLDVGCGFGAAACLLAESLKCKVIGIDVDMTLVMEGKRRVAEKRLDDFVQIKVMDAHQLDFPDASMDVVISEGVISGLNVNTVLKEIARVLKPGGMFGMSDAMWKRENVPLFVLEAWGGQGASIQIIEKKIALLKQLGFDIRYTKDISSELDDYYLPFKKIIERSTQKRFKGVEQYKDLLIQYKHEIDVYFRMGGKKWMGYCVIVGKKR